MASEVDGNGDGRAEKRGKDDEIEIEVRRDIQGGKQDWRGGERKEENRRKRK